MILSYFLFGMILDWMFCDAYFWLVLKISSNLVLKLIFLFCSCSEADEKRFDCQWKQKKPCKYISYFVFAHHLWHLKKKICIVNDLPVRYQEFFNVLYMLD